jgi:hypothetical protein
MADPGQSPGTQNQYPITGSNTTTAASGTTTPEIPFPELVFAAVIVGAGIYYLYTVDSRAGWALAGLVVLAIAFGYPQFQTELTAILKNIQTVTPGNTVTAGNPSNAQPGSIGSLYPNTNIPGSVNQPTGNTATA